MPTVVIALGSNLGDRRYNLLRAMHELRPFVRVVRISSIHETAPVGAPEGSPPFLNAVLTGYTLLEPLTLLEELLTIEQRLGRVRRGIRNEPRVIDLDLILHGATRMRTRRLTLPHPRAHEREFVLAPMREVWTAVTTVTALTASIHPAMRAGAALARTTRRDCTSSGLPHEQKQSER